MPTVTLSTRGQIVIPAEVRREAGWKAGDKMTVVTDPDNGEVRLRKKETLDELAERLSHYLKPGAEPLTDVHGFFDQREARL